MSSLKEKIAIITGATSGIGYEISINLINKGIKVYLIGRSFDKFKNELLVHSDKLNFIKLDLQNDVEIENFIGKIDHEETIDILIHSAGVISLGSFEKSSIDDLDHQYKINVRASYLITQKLLPKIKRAKGDIIFLNSTVGLDSWQNISQYSATKHALKALANSLRKEISKSRTRVTSLYLGSTNTAMQEKVQKLRGISYNSSIFMDAKEIANVVLFVINLPKNMTITDMTLLPNT